MSDGVAAEANGHATRAEHKSLAELVARQGKQLDFIEQQVKLIGRAMELLLLTQGLDMPEGSDD